MQADAFPCEEVLQAYAGVFPTGESVFAYLQYFLLPRPSSKTQPAMALSHYKKDEVWKANPLAFALVGFDHGGGTSKVLARLIEKAYQENGGRPGKPGSYALTMEEKVALSDAGVDEAPPLWTALLELWPSYDDILRDGLPTAKEHQLGKVILNMWNKPAERLKLGLQKSAAHG